MTATEYIEKIKQLPSKVEALAIESVIVPAANRMLAGIINRNVNEGKNTDGSKRTGYSNKPGYYGKDKFAVKSAFRGRGKTGNKTKTMYLQNGYFELRQIQGRQTDIVNYDYTGATLNDFRLKAQQGVVVIGFTTDRSSRIRKGLEKKRGAAFKPSKEEIEEYKKEVTEGLKKINQNIAFSIE